MIRVWVAAAAVLFAGFGGAGLHAESAPPNAVQDFKIEATKTLSLPGGGTMYSGDVRVTTLGVARLSVQSWQGGLLLRRSGSTGPLRPNSGGTGSDVVGTMPFDASTEMVEIGDGTVTFRDKAGHSLTVIASAPNSITAVVVPSVPPPVNPPQDQEPEPKPRRIDPVTDRGAVIP